MENVYQSEIESGDNVYLLITDLHWKETNFAGRISYKTELSLVVNKIYELIDKYSSLGKKVYLIFLGDIYHNAFKSAVQGAVFNNLMINFRDMVEDAFTLVGNHEITYYEENPFWTLFTKIDSTKVTSLVHKIWTPTGVRDTLRVVDGLVDGDVRFIFNHHGSPATVPVIDGKVNIGLFHIDLYAKAIADDMRRTMGLDIFEHTPVYFDGSGALYGYDYAFMAHMHKFYGKWDYICDRTGYPTKLSYLASLGRTNHTEVINTFLERDIPAIHVRDGKLYSVESNIFNLMSREECVNEAVIEKQKEARILQQEKKQVLTSYAPIDDDPIKNMEANLIEMPIAISVMRDLLVGNKASFEDALLKELEAIKWL